MEVEVDLAQEIEIEDVLDPGHVNDQENNRLLLKIVIKIEIAIGIEIVIGTVTEIGFGIDDRIADQDPDHEIVIAIETGIGTEIEIAIVVTELQKVMKKLVMYHQITQ